MRAIWEKQELSDNSRGVIHKPTPSVEKDLPPVKSEEKTDFSRPQVSYLYRSLLRLTYRDFSPVEQRPRHQDKALLHFHSWLTKRLRFTYDGTNLRSIHQFVHELVLALSNQNFVRTRFRRAFVKYIHLGRHMSEVQAFVIHLGNIS